MKSVKTDKVVGKTSRRDFLQKSLMVGASVATVAAVPTQVLASAEKTPKLNTKKEEGYRLSKHIEAYYKSAQL